MSNEQYAVTENSGYTYRGRKTGLRPPVKSRIDSFLISEALYDYVGKARIIEEESATTDHKMIVMTLGFNQFAQGMGYYRCPNNLLQDETFKKVLKPKVESCLWRHTEQTRTTLTKKAQEQTHDIGATELLMEIINCVREITAHYARIKHQAMTGDKEDLRNGKKTHDPRA